MTVTETRCARFFLENISVTQNNELFILLLKDLHPNIDANFATNFQQLHGEYFANAKERRKIQDMSKMVWTWLWR